MRNSAGGELHFLRGTGQRVPVNRASPGKLGVTCQHDGKVSGKPFLFETALQQIPLDSLGQVVRWVWQMQNWESTPFPGLGNSSDFASSSPPLPHSSHSLLILQLFSTKTRTRSEAELLLADRDWVNFLYRTFLRHGHTEPNIAFLWFVHLLTYLGSCPSQPVWLHHSSLGFKYCLQLYLFHSCHDLSSIAKSLFLSLPLAVRSLP